MPPTLILVALAALAVSLLISEAVLQAVGLDAVKVGTATWLGVMVVLLLGSSWADAHTSWGPGRNHLAAVLVGSVVTGMWFNDRSVLPRRERHPGRPAELCPADAEKGTAA